MKTLNSVSKDKNVSREDWQKFIITLAPFAPYITEELWHLMGNNDSIHIQKWPKVNLSQKQSGEETDISIQINGKHRARLGVATQNPDQLVADIIDLPAIQKYVAGKKIIKHIYVPGKVFNLIVE
jgi:leucyl-tRNA synthetase